MVQTPSCVAGVRGTEFSVFAGADGSALIVVDSGQVEVESEGKAVQLTTDEGVEVQPGEPPGDKFVIKSDQIDYRTWNDEKLQNMLDDPLLAMERLTDRLGFYINNVDEYFMLLKDYEQKVADAREKVNEIFDEKGKDAATKYQNENVFPLSEKRRNSFINVRFFSLATLSMRRYVAGRLYLFMKSSYITNTGSETYQDFESLYYAFLHRFEESIIPHIVEIDL
jgi:hypothetical protein